MTMMPRTTDEVIAHRGPVAVAHSQRFRKVSNRYPRRVAEAYVGDLARAMADDDATVAATVADWERANGVPVRDWQEHGRREEGRDDDGGGPL